MKGSKQSTKTQSKRKSNKKGKSLAQHLKERKWAMGILLVCTFLVYLPSLQNGFVNWDDNTYVYENEALTGMDIGAILTEPMAHNYHPLTMLSLAANYAISGFEPFSYHLTNLLLHLLNTLLVFWLLYEMTKRNIPIAFVAALIFGIHPMHIESVAWVSERKDLLYTLFFLPALLAYIRYIKTKNTTFYGAAFALFILSLLSKPAAVIFPIVLFLFDLWYNRKRNMRLVLEKIPFLLCAIGMGLYTIHIQGDLEAIASIEQYSFVHRVLFAGYGFIFYLFKFLIPYPILPFHAYPNTEANIPLLFWLSPLIAVGILGFVFWKWRRSKVMVFGILFYLLNLLLVLQLVAVGGAVVSERYTYVPYIGLGLILAYWWKRWTAKFPPYKNLINGALGLWLLLLGVYTFQQTKIWKSGETLWGYQIQQLPKSGKGLINMGVYYMEGYKKDRSNKTLINKALEYFNKALEYYPNDINALNERAGVYFEFQDVESGFKDVNHLLQVDPNFYRAYLNRAILHSISNNHAEAVKDYDRYLQSKPKDDKAYNWRGISYLHLQNFEEALINFNQAIQINPQSGEYYFNRARAYTSMGQESEVQKNIQKAKQLGFKVPE